MFTVPLQFIPGSYPNVYPMFISATSVYPCHFSVPATSVYLVLKYVRSAIQHDSH
jgi:hypothetical protein